MSCHFMNHYNDVIMSAMASQITSLTIVYSTVYWEANKRKHQSSASLAFVRGIHLWPVNSPHKWPVTRKMFPFDDVIMIWTLASDFLMPKYQNGKGRLRNCEANSKLKYSLWLIRGEEVRNMWYLSNAHSMVIVYHFGWCTAYNIVLYLYL